jgi:restriction system protein
MADAVLFEDIPAGRAGSRLSLKRRNGLLSDIARLLDALPWWALVALAALIFLLLHQLAAAGGGPASPATGPTASQAILIVLADAGQYLFPVLLLVEAAGVAVASRRARSRDDSAAQDEAVISRVAEIDEADEPGRGHEPPAQAQRVWSLALLNRLEPLHFAALAMAYYRARGMRCELMKSREGTPVLKLFQDHIGTSLVIVRFRTRGAPWVGAKPIEALRDVMAREGIAKGLFMTPGAFSRDAKECARANGITLVDGSLFLMMIRRLSPPVRERLLSLALQTR